MARTPLSPLAWKTFRPVDPNRDYEALAIYFHNRSYRHVPLGIYHGLRVEAQLKRSPGLAAYGMAAKDLKLEYWVVSLWESVRDLMTFVHTPPHSETMRVWLPRLADGSVARRPIRGAQWPLSPGDLDRMLDGGRPLVLPPR